MTYYVLKVGLTVLLVVGASEVARRSAWAGALIASLPLVSILAMTWLFSETRDTERVAALAGSILWMVLPSLVLFILLPILLRRAMPFAAALGLSCGTTAAAYGLTLWLVSKLGHPF